MPIYLERVTKNYRSGWTLGPLDLEIEEGEIFGFLGPNGAGKTTAGKLLTGLLRPSSGIVRIRFARHPAGGYRGPRGNGLLRIYPLYIVLSKTAYGIQRENWPLYPCNIIP